MMTALVHGVPQLTVPSIPDQMMNSERLAATGAGRLVPAGSARLDVLRKEIEAVLTERAVADAASRMAARMAELPTAHQVATALEEFA